MDMRRPSVLTLKYFFKISKYCKKISNYWLKAPFKMFLKYPRFLTKGGSEGPYKKYFKTVNDFAQIRL